MKRRNLSIFVILLLIIMSFSGCKKENNGGEDAVNNINTDQSTAQVTQEAKTDNAQNSGQSTDNVTTQAPTEDDNITAEPGVTDVPADETPTPEPVPEGKVYNDGYQSPVGGGKEFFNEEKLTASGLIPVASEEEFIEAIKPGAKIVIKPGRYDLSTYMEKVWSEKGAAWNAEHEYVRLEQEFDGVELVIMNIDGLEISGGSEDRSDTEIVVEPRYAAVLTFEKSKNIRISNLTMGHTETGDCSGNVIDLIGAKTVGMYNLDLYGCGVYGIGANKGWADVKVFDSTIRDCSGGAFIVDEGLGDFYFFNCEMVGSGWCSYSPTADSSMTVEKCTFGEYETFSVSYDDSITAVDCNWSEITEYPIIDVDPEYEEYYELDDPEFKPSDFNFDIMEAAVGKDYIVMSPGWTAYMIINPATGETTYLPHYDEAEDMLISYLCGFSFGDEGPEGYLYVNDDYSWFKWYYSSSSSIVIEMPDGTCYYGDLYRDMDAERAHTWLLLNMGKYNVWFY